MSQAVPMVEIWRGPFLESLHLGQAVICDDSGQIVQAWGDPDAVVLPRSSSKMLQALPLVRSGAADAASLGTEHLALACASHAGQTRHTERVTAWLHTLGLTESDLRCGTHMPYDDEARDDLIRSGQQPCQCHNNCSGKHTGFLTLTRHLKAGPEYVEPDHPVQKACLEAFEEATGETSPGFGIDGCSAPNFAASLHGIARAMARFAAAPSDSPEARIHRSMRLHPDLVSGTGRACTDLMQAMNGRVVIKTGAEGFFVAILPDQKRGVALKIQDGTTRASESAMAAILVKLGALDPKHPAALKYMSPPITNRAGLITGNLRPSAALS